jgi:hypothetical protein
VLSRCGDAAQAAGLVDELTARFPTSTQTMWMQVPIDAAALALQRGDAAQALARLEAVVPYDHAPSSEFWPAYLRGEAHLRLGDGRSAGIQFQSILDHRGEQPASLLYPLARLGLARALARSGDTAGARKAYDAFFAGWTGADADVKPLADARREYAGLR